MNILQFSEKLTSGIEIIDKQHCELIRLINQLENIPVHNIKLNQLMELLNNIKRVGKQHFCDEERIMENKNFPDCNFHKVQHEKFINIFTDLINVLTTQSDFQSDLKRNLKNIKKIVNLWLFDHLDNYDSVFWKYRKELLEKGEEAPAGI